MKRYVVRLIVFGLQVLSLCLCLATALRANQIGQPMEQPSYAFLPLLALGAIQAGTSLIGGLLGRSAAKKAAELQAKANEKAAGDLQSRNDEVNQNLTTTARTVGEQARAAAGESTARVDAATGNANALLNPYISTGSKASSLLSTALDDSGKMPTLDQIQIDPGYNFRLQEGVKALQSRAASLGLATGGGTIKATEDYAQRNASQEYANAFARFQQNRQQNIQNLIGISGQGQSAATTAGGNLLSGGKYGADLNYGSTTYAGDKNFAATEGAGQNSLNTAGKVADLTTGAAAARAGGIVGGNNALAQGIGGAANAATSAYTTSQILKNPSYIRPTFKTSGSPNFLYNLDAGVRA